MVRWSLFKDPVLGVMVSKLNIRTVREASHQIPYVLIRINVLESQQIIEDALFRRPPC